MNRKNLKEIYVLKKINIINESIDQKKLETLIKIINDIESVVSVAANKMPLLSAAINNAKEVAYQKLLGKEGFWKKLLSNLNDKLNVIDELKDFITFESSMISGLKNLPQIINLLKKNGINFNDENHNITLDKIFTQESTNRLQIVKLISKSFLPKSNIFGNKKLPFVNDIELLSTQFFNLTPSEIEEISGNAANLPNIPLSNDEMKNITNSSNLNSEEEFINPESKKDLNVKVNNKIPNFEDAMKSIGVNNIHSNENTKTINAFKNFYNYISNNVK